jgi:aminoglycoside 3-N-acetyltransferase
MTTSRAEKFLFRIPPFAEFLLRVASQLRPQGNAASAAVEAAPTVRVPEAEILEFFRSAGIVAGSVTMVHSDSKAIERVGWAPSEFLDLLQRAVGPEGTLMMPSHAALQTVGDLKVYDPRRCPSTVGLLTELFRRRPGVRRSLFPLSPVAACGPLAAEMLDEHADSWAPHDEKSPYYKMIARGSKVLCVGVPLDRMTLIHVAEDVLREQWPVGNFYEAREYGIKVSGETRNVTVHARAAWLWWYLAKYRWSREICRRGFVRGACWNGVMVRVADAQKVFDWMASEVKRGRTIYPLARWNGLFRLGDPRRDEAQ